LRWSELAAAAASHGAVSLREDDGGVMIVCGEISTSLSNLREQEMVSAQGDDMRRLQASGMGGSMASRTSVSCG